MFGLQPFDYWKEPRTVLGLCRILYSRRLYILVCTSSYMIIKKVFQSKHTGQKFVTIPKKSDIEEGDYVKIIKVEDGE